MDDLFISVLNMSFTASYVIVCVILLRFLLKRAPKIWSYLLWTVVLFRLICPFSIESAWSLLAIHTRPIPQDIAYQAKPQIYSGLELLNHKVNEVLPAATPQYSTNPLQIWIALGEMVWIIGIVVLLLYSLISLFLLKKKLQAATAWNQNIFLVENLKTPFVFGLIRPKIYLPAELAEKERAYILLHEQTHIKRKDYLVKAIAFLVLCVHWFNPLVWLAFVLMTKDMEMSCDEAVLKKLGKEIKKEYSSSLLALASGYHVLGGAPLAFGEGEVKGRVKNVLHYKRPKVWAIGIVAVVVVAGISGLACNSLNNRVNISILDEQDILVFNDNEFTWYLTYENVPGAHLYVCENGDYLFSYYGDEGIYGYYTLEAKLIKNTLELNIKEEMAVSESYISDYVVARISVSVANVETVLVKKEEEIIESSMDGPNINITTVIKHLSDGSIQNYTPSGLERETIEDIESSMDGPNINITTVTKHLSDGSIQTYTPSGLERETIEECIFHYYLDSAAWSAVDVSQCGEYYEFYYLDELFQVFQEDGISYLQVEGGMYSQNTLYDYLDSLFADSNRNNDRITSYKNLIEWSIRLDSLKTFINYCRDKKN